MVINKEKWIISWEGVYMIKKKDNHYVFNSLYFYGNEGKLTC